MAVTMRSSLTFSITAFLFILLLAYGTQASAATYYVDSVNGNDSNAGTSTSAPWKNSPGMSGWSGLAKLAPGDTVYFNSSQTWGVCKSSGGFYLPGGVTYIGDSWGGGTRATIMATCQCDGGVIRFYDDPTHPTVFKGFNVDANHTVSSGIDLNERFGAPLTGATKRIENCEVHNVASTTTLAQYKYGIIVSNHCGSGCETDNVEIINNKVHDISRDGLCLYPGDETSSIVVNNMTVRGNEVYNTGQDTTYDAGSGLVVKGHVVNATVENNYVHNIPKGSGIFINGNESNHYGTGPTNIHIRYNIVDDGGGAGGGGGIRVYDKGSDPKDLKFYGNIIMNDSSDGGISLDGNSGNLSLLVYNNTLYNAFINITNQTSTIQTFDLRDNIIYAPSGRAALLTNGAVLTTHANNIYYGSGTLVTYGGTSYSASNLASFESTASAANPLFKNTGSLPTGFTGTYGSTLAPNADGLSLQSTSYGRGHGGSLSSPYNNSINSVARTSGAWDIGAYQAGSSTLAKPNPPSLLTVQ